MIASRGASRDWASVELPPATDDEGQRRPGLSDNC